ncbi:Up-regulated during septation-domain-containing protein [Melanogaster broomeanus]|nr:Up-regulated during septation-domain-containing protein [Melanogaster broomeanus]
MDGVRRFLVGSGTSPTNSQPQPPPDPSPPPAPVTLSPASSFVVTGNPSSPPQDSPPTSSSDLRSASGTAGLVIRKDKVKSPLRVASEPPTTEEAPRNTSFQSVNPASVRSPTGSLSSHHVASPPRKSVPNGGTSILGSPYAGPSSPQPLSLVQPRNSDGTDWKPVSGLVNTRDDLLVSLLTSEAVVDSRECEILSAEEVEELKKEHHTLTIRRTAMQKKLDLETKIRDAVLSLSRVNKKVSKETQEQLETAERKVAAAQKELWRVSERTSEVHRRLLEHRAGVLGYSVHNMEKKMIPDVNGGSEIDVSGPVTPNRSPLLSSVASAASTPLKARFDGAHLFAGHARAQIPKALPTATDLATLEAKLRAATELLNIANKKNAEMARELSHLRLEKEQIETTMSIELQNAEETVADLEKELPRLGELQVRCDELMEERAQWEEDRAKLAAREEEVERLEGRLEVLEEKCGEVSEVQRMLADIQEKADADVRMKEEELSELKLEYEEAYDTWEAEKVVMEEDRLKDLTALQDELDQLRRGSEARSELDGALEVLHTLMQLHDVRHSSNDPSLQGLLASLGAHLETVSTAMQEHSDAYGEWESLRERLEFEIQARHQEHQVVLEDLRRERDDAKREALSSAARVKELTTPSVYDGPPIEYKGEVADVVALLQPLWAVLPAPELRAAKLDTQRHLRTASTASSPDSPSSKSGLPSLSDMDIRSLKALYDTKSAQAAVGGNFSLEAFVARVQALVIDDRTLIQRLIRGARDHDLVKKNAERAQKLAQESNAALETYQQQVATLDDQNFALQKKQADLTQEIQDLRGAVERAMAEKREVETHAADQAETCRQLTEVNNTLSAKTLSLAQEAASAPEIVRKQFERQLAECKTALREAQEEVEAMRTSEQTQRIALLDELNSMQTDNANLRAQLRAIKK